MIATVIARAFPNDGVVAGEGGLADGLPPGRYTWIVDEASGGCPVSVGVLRDRMPFAGAVYDPVARWLFTACVGRGAWLNDRPLYAGWGLPSPRKVTAAGSTALRLCYVALGELDVVHEHGVSLMDIAGAAPIIMEAGGVLTSGTGAPLFPRWPAPVLSAPVAILAGSPTSHKHALG